MGCLLAHFEGPWEEKSTESVKRVSGATPASASRNACPTSFPPVPGPPLGGFGAVLLHPGQEGVQSEAGLQQGLQAAWGRGCLVARRGAGVGPSAAGSPPACFRPSGSVLVALWEGSRRVGPGPRARTPEGKGLLVTGSETPEMVRGQSVGSCGARTLLQARLPRAGLPCSGLSPLCAGCAVPLRILPAKRCLGSPLLRLRPGAPVTSVSASSLPGTLNFPRGGPRCG